MSVKAMEAAGQFHLSGLADGNAADLFAVTLRLAPWRQVS
jgi:hypothetical protein